jgi:hypothetical protein
MGSLWVLVFIDIKAGDLRILTWGDTITVKRLLIRQRLSIPLRLLPDLLRLLRRSEPPTTLLVHLRPWSHSIHSYENSFFGFIFPNRWST